MKKLTLILLCFTIALSVHVVLAQDSVEELQKKIDSYSKKLSELSGKEKTLANEIAYMDGQINITQLRIQSSAAKIEKTKSDIVKLAANIEDIKLRMVKLVDSIGYQQKVLGARIRARYKIQESSPVIVLFGSTTINQLIQKAEYLQVMEISDNRLLSEMDKTKTAYTKQKSIFEDQKSQTEKLKSDLENEKANLDAYNRTLLNQKAEKAALLSATQNSETKYQSLLAAATQELNQITGAVGVLKNTAPRHVKAGDTIGIQGSSGHSTGDHLHFGVYRYSSFAQIDGWNWYYSNYVNPSTVLKSKSVYWDTGCESAGNKTVGSGSWSWPLSHPNISQGFGHTCWSNVYYGGKDHPAYDMYDTYGAPVYAAADGDAYTCRNCLGDGGNGVFIFHKNNYMTLYWHLR